MYEQLEMTSNQPSVYDMLTIPEASMWASKHVGRDITTSNISYLIQYGRIRKHSTDGCVKVLVDDLEKYYSSYDAAQEMNYKAKLGDDINWTLSFSRIKESETTKHVHRLHPYKGKFIPQLVEYFIDEHTDTFKTDVFFKKGDTILDPFSGSGTTMVQANECGINAVGIDVSAFNALIANCKVAKYNLVELQKEIDRISSNLRKFVAKTNIAEFENRLLEELNKFNSEYFPVPDYKYRLRQGKVDERVYGTEKERQFLPIYENLINEFGIVFRQESKTKFLEKWFSKHIRDEIEFVFAQVREVDDLQTRKIMAVILSRTMRSCRATTHSDLATLIDPVTTTYYCAKHGKICKPLFSIIKWWDTYCKDTIKRLDTFNKLRTSTMQYCITGDSRTIDIMNELQQHKPRLGEIVSKNRINGIFSSPPYVGMIDYHEQHAYAYDLFGFERQDDFEIGPMFKGKGKEAQKNYTEGIAQVLINSKRILVDDYNVFLVANDRHNLYPAIAEKAGMTIINTFRRPVLNRSEKDKTAYSETIFHFKERSR